MVFVFKVRKYSYFNSFYRKKSAFAMSLLPEKGKIPKPSLDEIDRKILAALQRDAKLNVKHLADELNLSKTPVYERIRRLEQEGVIKKYVAVLDRNKLPSSMVVFCSVSLEVQKIEKIEQFSRQVAEIPEVLECYLMGGTSDFMLKVIVQDLAAYHHFSSGKLAALPNVSQIKSAFVLHEVKQGTVVPLFQET